MKSLIKHLLALAISIGIAFIGILCVETQIKLDPQEISWTWFFSFLGVCFIIIRPVCYYWGNTISDLLDIEKTEKP